MEIACRNVNHQWHLSYRLTIQLKEGSNQIVGCQQVSSIIKAIFASDTVQADEGMIGYFVTD